jgi:hypothetical protein
MKAVSITSLSGIKMRLLLPFVCVKLYYDDPENEF